MIRGAKRILGIRPCRLRKEITKDILLSLLHQLNPMLHDDMNLYAAFCLAFAAFLRCGEFTWNIWTSESHLTNLSRRSVLFKPDGHAALHLPYSKTDPFHQGITIQLARAPDISCPVTALSRLFQHFPTTPTAPLFSRLSGPFSSAWVIERLRALLLTAGFDPTGFSGHSFRRGAANTALNMGLSMQEISTLGRWHSDSLDRYISTTTAEANLLSLSARLHSRSGPSASVSAPTPVATVPVAELLDESRASDSSESEDRS